MQTISLHPNAFQIHRPLYPHWVDFLPIDTADDAEKIAIEYMRKRTGKTIQNVNIARVVFDGTFFLVHGDFTQSETLFDFNVKVDKEGKVVGWYAHSAPDF